MWRFIFQMDLKRIIYFKKLDCFHGSISGYLRALFKLSSSRPDSLQILFSETQHFPHEEALGDSGNEKLPLSATKYCTYQESPDSDQEALGDSGNEKLPLTRRNVEQIPGRVERGRERERERA